MAQNLADVMDAMGVALASISGLRVSDFPPKSAQAPFAFVEMPDTIDYDTTYSRGSDTMTFRVVVGVASQVDRTSRDEIALYAAGSGPKSVKEALEDATIGEDCRVVSVDFGWVQMASGTFLGATFNVEVRA